MARAAGAMTVRELVEDVRREMLKGNITPDRGAQLDARLSALLGNCFEEIREADLEYNVVLLQMFKVHTKANRAKIEAETTAEFVRRREARDTHTLVLEMIHSLRHLGRVASEEMRLQRG